MATTLQLLSTDFDGTLHSDYEQPAVPPELQERLGELQAAGATWCINTGRDLTGLMEGIARARLSVRPDYLVTVEREIYIHENHEYVPHREWNDQCAAEQEAAFDEVRPALPKLVAWIRERFDAEIYEDAFSPFCLIARDNDECDAIQSQAEDFLADWPTLDFVRNDIYARLSHTAYNKGSALGEVARLTGVDPEYTLAAGDHLNDLPMLTPDRARWLVTQHNAIRQVKEHVQNHGGFVSSYPCGNGLLEGIDRVLEKE
tara:strand:+ start:770 stop:1546 length:777 start_codon:yes stop_codon:yes gene_type:complete